MGGKYKFVLTTHIDKGHIHNHLIFKAVSFTDYKRYHSNKHSYDEILRASDRLCRECGLSIIVPAGTRTRATLSIKPRRTVPATRQSAAPPPTA